MKFFARIREVVKFIPKGKVLTYGQVADILQTKDARKVGWALMGNQDPLIPCHRVIRKGGYLAERFSLGGWEEQKRRPEKDGVGFLEQKRVDMGKHALKTEIVVKMIEKEEKELKRSDWA